MKEGNTLVEAENVNHPGKTERVEARKYHEMRRVLLARVPKDRPGMVLAELSALVLPHLSEEIFPGGATAGWWFKCVHLDLEAKKIIAREDKAPVRLYLC